LGLCERSGWQCTSPLREHVAEPSNRPKWDSRLAEPIAHSCRWCLEDHLHLQLLGFPSSLLRHGGVSHSPSRHNLRKFRICGVRPKTDCLLAGNNHLRETLQHSHMVVRQNEFNREYRRIFKWSRRRWASVVFSAQMKPRTDYGKSGISNVHSSPYSMHSVKLFSSESSDKTVVSVRFLEYCL